MFGTMAALGLGVGLGLAATSVAAQSTTDGAVDGRIEWDIRVLGCDGAKWLARWEGDRIRTWRDTDASPELGRVAAEMHYRTWGGECWWAKWDPAASAEGLFEHHNVRTQASHLDSILNYVDWDGREWTVRRKGENWVMTPRG